MKKKILSYFGTVSDQTVVLELKQCNRSMEEYEIEFTRLSKFASRLISIREEKTKFFIKGLRPEIQGSVSAHAS